MRPYFLQTYDVNDNGGILEEYCLTVTLINKDADLADRYHCVCCTLDRDTSSAVLTDLRECDSGVSYVKCLFVTSSPLS